MKQLSLPPQAVPLLNKEKEFFGADTPLCPYIDAIRQQRKSAGAESAGKNLFLVKNKQIVA